MSTLTNILESYIEKEPEILPDYASSKELLDAINKVIRDFRWLPNEVKKEVLYLSRVYSWGLLLCMILIPVILTIFIATFSNKMIILWIIPTIILYFLGLYPYAKLYYIKSKYKFDVFKLKEIEYKLN